MERESDNPEHWLVLEPAQVPAEEPKTKPTPAAATESTEQHPANEQVTGCQARGISVWLDDTGLPIIRATRSWIQYGMVGFAVMCIVIGALESLLGR